MHSIMRRVYLELKISHDIKLRHAPELKFKLDSSMEYGRHIDEIIDEINKPER